MNTRKADWSLVPRRLKQKLLVSATLMVVIPMLVTAFIIHRYILFSQETAWSTYEIGFVFLMTMVIAALGWVLIKNIIDPIVHLSINAKRMVEGDASKKIQVDSEDEIGELAGALNEMAERIKKGMNELNSYGKRVETINTDINRKILTLSSVLQITDLMSQSVKVDAILDLVMDKVMKMIPIDQGILFVLNQKGDLAPRTVRGSHPEMPVSLGRNEYETFQAAKNRKMIRILDKEHMKDLFIGSFLAQFHMRCGMVIPLVYKSRFKGLLVVGRTSLDYSFKDDEKEALNLFREQVTIALENEHLTSRAKKLEVRDEVTKLYNERYIRGRLDEEIERAIQFQRPCSFITIEIDQYEQYQRENAKRDAEHLLRQVGQIMHQHIGEFAKAGYMGHGIYTVIVPEKHKGEAVQIAEAIRAHVLRSVFNRLSGSSSGRVTISAGVSGNPIDGLDAQHLIDKARVALEEAATSGQNRVVA
jgi:diguanylate cyclase (GGDEF)-like protein